MTVMVENYAAEADQPCGIITKTCALWCSS